jgi:hypothetical protein
VRTGEQSTFKKTQQEPQSEQLSIGLYQTHTNLDDRPQDHNRRNPSARSELFENEVGEDVERAVADEEDTALKSVSYGDKVNKRKRTHLAKLNWPWDMCRSLMIPASLAVPMFVRSMKESVKSRLDEGISFVFPVEEDLTHVIQGINFLSIFQSNAVSLCAYSSADIARSWSLIACSWSRWVDVGFSS